MKVLDYLYYKLYRATLRGSLWDIAEYSAVVYFGGLIFVNLFVIGAFLRKLDVISVFIAGEKQVIIFMTFLFTVSYFLFLYKKRYKKIIAKYEQESEVEQKRGNRAVSLYVVISFVLMLLVAFYKPGKL